MASQPQPTAAPQPTVVVPQAQPVAKLSPNEAKLRFKQQVQTAGLVAGLYLVFASPVMYILTGKLLPALADSHGCPSTTGTIVHGVIFGVLAWVIMTYSCHSSFLSKNEKLGFTAAFAILFVALSNRKVYNNCPGGLMTQAFDNAINEAKKAAGGVKERLKKYREAMFSCYAPGPVDAVSASVGKHLLLSIAVFVLSFGVFWGYDKFILKNTTYPETYDYAAIKGGAYDNTMNYKENYEAATAYKKFDEQ